MLHDIHALFLGPKSENRKFFKEMIDFVMDEHIHWRRDFHPSDRPVVSVSEQRGQSYSDILVRTEEALLELSSRLKSGSVPAFSPRYLGHMISDTLMAANLGYLATILYNPNNCSYDASSASTLLELEVGEQLARLFGFDPARSWGHITSGGTVANFEALWVARNLKSLVAAVEQFRPELLSNFSPLQRANLPVATTLDLLSQLKREGHLEAVRRHTAQHRGATPALGQVLLPQSKHYSWNKGVDVLGLGQDSLIFLPVDANFRVNITELRQRIKEMIREARPILAVVAVAGTTEVGAVDPIDAIVELRQELEQELGVGFYLHIDGAYGGYVRTVFVDEAGTFMPLEQVRDRLADLGCASGDPAWPTPEVHAAFGALAEVDSITVDPHKLGYVPYAAGAIVMKDRRVLDLISYFADYVFERDGIEPEHLGAFIMEGSRPGASAASVWMAHRVLPLDVSGYGKLLAHSIHGTQRLFRAFRHDPVLDLEGRRFSIEPVACPDLNVIDFVIKESRCQDLEEINRLNRYLYEQCSYRSGPVYLEDFILSKTVLHDNIYGQALCDLLQRLGVPASQWSRVGQLFVLRSCMMTPYLTSNLTFDEYEAKFRAALRRHLQRYAHSSLAGTGLGRPQGSYS